MRSGLTIFPGGLLVVLLTAGATFAAEPPCPISQTSRPRLFLQTDHLQIAQPAELAESAERDVGYRLDTSLIDASPSADPQKTDNSPVELRSEQELAALRIRTDGAVTPYVGAGLTTVPEVNETPGISKFEAELESERQAYLLGAGLACDLSHSARLNLGYRYAGSNLPELSGSKPTATETDRDDHHISFGLKLDF